jgi:hypothetical protein
VELVVRVVDRGACVDISEHGTGAYIRVVDRRAARFFDFDGVRLKAFAPPISLLERIGQFRDPTDRRAFGRQWQPVTRRLSDALRDDGWLRAQLSSPRYADTPAGGE